MTRASFAMHYHSDDVSRLLQRLPAMTLLSAARFESAWGPVTELGEELASLLAQYPQVRYEKLDLHYALRQALSVLDEALIEDLCTHYGWSGVAFAALLAALAPAPSYGPALRRAVLQMRDPWLVALAVARCENAFFQPSVSAVVLQQLAEQLAAMPRPSVRPLRRLPGPEELQTRQAAVAHAYRIGGADAALEALRVRNDVGQPF